jgi:hypothetical protein
MGCPLTVRMAGVAVGQGMMPRLMAILLCTASTAALAAPPSVSVGDAFGAHWTQVMFYIGKSVGPGAGMRPTYGLRIEQIRIRPNTPSQFGSDNAFQHRELLMWQMQGGADIRVKLGRNVTLNVSKHAFEPSHAASEISPTLVVHDRATLDTSRPHSLSLGSAALSVSDAYRLWPSCDVVASTAPACSAPHRTSSSNTPRPAYPVLRFAKRTRIDEIPALLARDAR